MNSNQKEYNLAEERRLLERVESMVRSPVRRMWPVALPINEVLLETLHRPTLSDIHFLLLRTLDSFGSLSPQELSQLVGIETSALRVALSALATWKLISENDGSYKLSKSGRVCLAEQGKLAERRKSFVFRFDGLTGKPCKRDFYDAYVSRRRAGLNFVKVPPTENPNLESAKALLSDSTEKRDAFKIPEGVSDFKEVAAFIETIWVPVFVVETAELEIFATLPQSSQLLSSEHPLVKDPASCGCELNLDKQLSNLQKELARRKMNDSILKTALSGFPSLDVDPKWLRDPKTGKSVGRMWFPVSSLVLELAARESGY